MKMVVCARITERISISQLDLPLALHGLTKSALIMIISKSMSNSTLKVFEADM